MTAWAKIQQDWATNSKNKEITGILLWDLSAAFDCLDADILCKKLHLYGFDPRSVAWFRSFLSQRTQRVKIEDCLSEIANLISGVPQGGILSPPLYIIYVADLQLWLKFVSAITYADDTSTSVSGKLLKDVIRMLEEDAKNVLKFMASNGLVANASKTTLMFLNNKRNSEDQNLNHTIQIGEATITQEKNAKLLGITLDDTQDWTTQITGTGGMIPSLNSRLFIIKRLSKALSKNRLTKLVDSLYTSKIRYGLQLFGKVRIEEDDPKQKLLSTLQVTQNKLARFLNGCNISDKINNKTIFENTKLTSVNQLNAQIKLLEVWKSQNNKDYPIKWNTLVNQAQRTSSRLIPEYRLTETGRTKISNSTFKNDAARLRNKAPQSIKNCKSLYTVKSEIKKFIKTLPL